MGPNSQCQWKLCAVLALWFAARLHFSLLLIIWVVLMIAGELQCGFYQGKEVKTNQSSLFTLGKGLPAIVS